MELTFALAALDVDLAAVAQSKLQANNQLKRWHSTIEWIYSKAKA